MLIAITGGLLIFVEPSRGENGKIDRIYLLVATKVAWNALAEIHHKPVGDESAEVHAVYVTIGVKVAGGGL
ncbi:MAG: hypothetical protein ACYSR6_08865 [Planctomycetota bacterium]|jgi:hypothetical protein